MRCNEIYQTLKKGTEARIACFRLRCSSPNPDEQGSALRCSTVLYLYVLYFSLCFCANANGWARAGACAVTRIGFWIDRDLESEEWRNGVARPPEEATFCPRSMYVLRNCRMQ